MRRISGILLLCLFSFPLIAPAVFAPDPDANLPACCRRDGKHKCSLASHASSSQGSAFQSVNCVSFPGAQAFPLRLVPGPLGVPAAVAAPIASQPVSRPQTEVLYRVAFSRAQHGRGPPLAFSSLN